MRRSGCRSGAGFSILASLCLGCGGGSALRAVADAGSDVARDSCRTRRIHAYSEYIAANSSGRGPSMGTR